MPRSLPLLEDTSPICCAPLDAPGQLSPQDALALAVRLKALADPTRLLLLSHLLSRPGQEASTGELARHVGLLSDPTVSHHLTTLESAGLLTKQRRGMSVYHRVVPEAIHAIARALHINACC